MLQSILESDNQGKVDVTSSDSPINMGRPEQPNGTRTAALSNLSAQPPVERTGWYNNCLCGHNPATSATPEPEGLGMSNTFKLL